MNIENRDQRLKIPVLRERVKQRDYLNGEHFLFQIEDNNLFERNQPSLNDKVMSRESVINNQIPRIILAPKNLEENMSN